MFNAKSLIVLIQRLRDFSDTELQNKRHKRKRVEKKNEFFSGVKVSTFLRRNLKPFIILTRGQVVYIRMEEVI